MLIISSTQTTQQGFGGRSFNITWSNTNNYFRVRVSSKRPSCSTERKSDFALILHRDASTQLQFRQLTARLQTNTPCTIKIEKKPSIRKLAGATDSLGRTQSLANFPKRRDVYTRGETCGNTPHLLASVVLSWQHRRSGSSLALSR